MTPVPLHQAQAVLHPPSLQLPHLLDQDPDICLVHQPLLPMFHKSSVVLYLTEAPLTPIPMHSSPNSIHPAAQNLQILKLQVYLPLTQNFHLGFGPVLIPLPLLPSPLQNPVPVPLPLLLLALGDSQ